MTPRTLDADENLEATDDRRDRLVPPQGEVPPPVPRPRPRRRHGPLVDLHRF